MKSDLKAGKSPLRLLEKGQQGFALLGALVAMLLLMMSMTAGFGQIDEKQRAREQQPERQGAQRQQTDATGQEVLIMVPTPGNEGSFTFVHTNLPPVIHTNLSEVAIDAHDYEIPCLICDGGSVPFCIFCNGDGDCPVCSGSGRMPCPFHDEAVDYASLPAPAVSLPAFGTALSSLPGSTQAMVSATAGVAQATAAEGSEVSKADFRPPAPAVADKSSGILAGSARQQLQIRAVLVLTAVLLFLRFCRWVGKLFKRRSKPQETRDTSGTRSGIAEEQSFTAFVHKFKPDGGNTDSSEAGVPSQVRLNNFFQMAPALLASLRGQLPEIWRAGTKTERDAILLKVLDQLRVVVTLANAPELLPARQLALALEGFLKQLSGNSASVDHSSWRSAVGAIMLLEALSHTSVSADILTNPAVQVLVVDDDPGTSTRLVSLLTKIFPVVDLAPNSTEAFPFIREKSYDLIFLDLETPGSDSAELCSQIRQTFSNAGTPVIFITRQANFDARVTSLQSNAEDLLAKPYLSFEIAVKALTFILATRLQRNEAAGTNGVPDTVGQEPEQGWEPEPSAAEPVETDQY